MRAKTIEVTNEVLAMLVKGQLRQAISNAPADLQVKTVLPKDSGIVLFCESEKWPDVEVPDEFNLVMKMPGSR